MDSWAPEYAALAWLLEDQGIESFWKLEQRERILTQQ